MIPALLIAITISPFAFILVLIFYLVAFQVESSILVPLIEGKVISFGPATVLFLVALGFRPGRHPRRDRGPADSRDRARHLHVPVPQR